jgi:isocitrate dehydrogenase
MDFVRKPESFDVVVASNLFGDILTDLSAIITGSMGMAASANINPERAYPSMFEPVHGSAPDIAGKGIANPTALVLSGLMMLRHIGLMKHAAVIENALLTALEQGVRTGDFGDQAKPVLSTKQYIHAIVERLGSKPATVAPVAVPEEGDKGPSFSRPARPAGQTVIRTFSNVVRHVVGCDIYLDTPLSPVSVAEEMQRICEDTPFKLSLVSNRGTQVWPTGSAYTECVDYYRVRFELKDGHRPGDFGQARCVALLDKVAEKFQVCSYELLRVFDGVKGYSLAQGQ